MKITRWKKMLAVAVILSIIGSFVVGISYPIHGLVLAILLIAAEFMIYGAIRKQTTCEVFKYRVTGTIKTIFPDRKGELPFSLIAHAKTERKAKKVIKETINRRYSKLRETNGGSIDSIVFESVEKL